MNIGEALAEREQHFGRLLDAVADLNPARRHGPITTVGERRDGTVRPHSAEAWLGFSPDLRIVTWFSAQRRRHSRDVMLPPKANQTVAYISGSLALNQQVSRPVLGMSFEAKGRLVEPGSERDKIMARWVIEGLFGKEEIEKYLTPENPDIPPHGVFAGDITEWRLMDTTASPRLVVFADDWCSDMSGRESLYGQHGFNPHLHLPLEDRSAS